LLPAHIADISKKSACSLKRLSLSSPPSLPQSHCAICAYLPASVFIKA